MNLQEQIRKVLKEYLNESDPKVGTGKKPKGSDRRLYTDENPSDTVSVKFRTKQDIVDDLEEADIKITVGDIVQMSKPNETSNVISFKISVPAEDLEKALDPTVWPLRVRVREFIHYRKRYSDRNGTTSVSDSDKNGTKSVEKNSATGGATAVQ
jgi:hypothetical protein